MVGKTLGHYRILEKIGAGGMGEVYRAHDERLEREVAIKVLPAGALADESARKRFRKEALALSKLSHPHVATVYDFDSQDGVDFLVLEFVRGPSLAEKLTGGPLAEKEIAKLGAQIASALEEAHERGIVHRDLKPNNVVLTEKGQVKVLDFGIAKLIRAGDETATTESLTQAHAAAGTLPYMAPEQVRGEEVDARTDVWALGVVLYEMAAGQRPFQGDDAVRLSAAILEKTPRSPRESKSKLSLGLENIILKALDKDPERRYKSARELRVDLERISTPTPIPTPAPRRRFARRWKVAAAGLMVFVVGGLAVLVFRWPPWRSLDSRPEMTPRQLTANPSEIPVFAAAISPNGRYLAFFDHVERKLALLLREIETGETRPLVLPEDFRVWDGEVSWFPDSTKLLLEVAGESRFAPEGHSVWSVSILGGIPRKLRDNAYAASVSPDGLLIAFLSETEKDRYEIWVMEASGANARKVVGADETGWLYPPVWSPDGRRIAYKRGLKGTDEEIIESRTLEGSGPTVIISDARLRLYFWMLNDPTFCWAPDGRIIYTRAELPPNQKDSNFWAIPTNHRTGQPTGEPRRITQWAGSSLSVPSISADGKRLAVVRFRTQGDVYWGALTEDGTRLTKIQRLTLDDRDDTPSGWTQDSQAVLFTSDRNTHVDIFKQGLESGTAEPVFVSSEDKSSPQSTPDGSFVLYRVYGKGSTRLMRIPSSGGPPELVLQSTEILWFQCTSRPSRICVLFEQGENEVTVFALDPLKGRGRELARMPDPKGTARFLDSTLSPDGSRIAFSHLEETVLRIRILALSDKTIRDLRVQQCDGFKSLAWSKDSQSMFVACSWGKGSYSLT